MKTHYTATGTFFARLVVVAMSMAFLGGCGSVDYGPAANRSVAQALSFKPPAGQSGIYVIREGGGVGAAAA